MKPSNPVTARVKIGPTDHLHIISVDSRKPYQTFIISSQILIWLLIFTTFHLPNVFGTTFVALSTDKAVVIGFDTKQGHQRDGHIVSGSAVCKVIIRKSTAYGLAGVTGISKGEDMYPVLNSIATDDVSTTMQAIKSPIMSFLVRHVPKMSADDLRPYAQGEKPIIVVLGIGFDRKGFMRDLSFFVDRNFAIRAVPTTYQNPGLAFPQTSHEITDVLPQDWRATNNPISLVRKLMIAGIKANPTESGYPISIVSISQSGISTPEWPKVCHAH